MYTFFGLNFDPQNTGSLWEKMWEPMAIFGWYTKIKPTWALKTRLGGGNFFQDKLLSE